MIRARFGKTAAGRLLIGAGALALLMSAIAGCEAGNNAPTLEFHAASAGTQTVFHGIRITNVFVLGAPSGSTVPAGQSASLFLSLYNGASSSDKLVSAAATGADSVTLDGGSVDLPADTAVNLTGPQPSVGAHEPVQAAHGRRVHPGDPGLPARRLGEASGPGRAAVVLLVHVLPARGKHHDLGSFLKPARRRALEAPVLSLVARPKPPDSSVR